MSDNPQDEKNSFFSDETEAPKKENPYLKKKREKEALAQPLPASEMLTDAKEDGYVHKRTFSDWMFEHVKLIATLATILVVLSLVLITDVVDVVEDLILQGQQADKEELSLTYVKGLSEKTGPVTWSDLAKFRRDENKTENTVTWMIPVKGTSYEIWVSGVDTSKSPSFVYLYDMQTGERMILGEDDFDAFIAAHS